MNRLQVLRPIPHLEETIPLFLSSWLWSKISISGSKGAIALSSSSLRGFHLD